VKLIALAVALGVAGALVPAWIRDMRRVGLVRENWRGRTLAFPAGAVLVASSLVTLAPLALLDDRADLDLLDPDLRRWIVYVLGVALLGLLDDSLGRAGDTGSPRGWRGHARAVLAGRFSTGAIKAVGAFALAAYAVSGRGRENLDYLADLALLLLTTNLFNLLDLRPGRVEKVYFLTLHERAMLGDTGSNPIGALAGVSMLETLGDPALLIALGIVVALNLYGEFRSITAFVDRVPLLRHLDSLGRPR
jgi:UDP-GlcNAc:undecaprenyl-phosphate/decaprenyl-phosphate GlcNAc-1-phosphate transferase